MAGKLVFYLPPLGLFDSVQNIYDMETKSVTSNTPEALPRWAIPLPDWWGKHKRRLVRLHEPSVPPRSRVGHETPAIIRKRVSHAGETLVQWPSMHLPEKDGGSPW